MSQDRTNMPPEATALPRSPDLMRAADTALLVVDVQERLLGAISAGQRIAWNCGRLLEGARVLGVHAAATEQNPDKLGGTVAELSRAFATPARAKMAFSCGACGALFSDWRTRGIDRVLVCGIETHVCVAQTVLDLLSSGFQTYVAVDAVGARAALDHEVALRRLEASGATLTTVEAALFEWCERAGTDEFRAISALVKQVPPAE